MPPARDSPNKNETKRQLEGLFHPTITKRGEHCQQHADLYEYHTKFLCNKYGEVHKFYGPSVELAKIEADVKELIKDQYEEKRYRDLIEPVDMFA